MHVFQNGKRCWCGDGDYSRYGTSSDCNFPCAGNTDQTCGGLRSVSVYKVAGEIKISVKRKRRHFDNIFVTCCTESCQNDNFECNQWRKCRQNDNFRFSDVLKKISKFWIANIIFIKMLSLVEPEFVILIDPGSLLTSFCQRLRNLAAVRWGVKMNLSLWY